MQVTAVTGSTNCLELVKLHCYMEMQRCPLKIQGQTQNFPTNYSTKFKDYRHLELFLQKDYDVERGI